MSQREFRNALLSPDLPPPPGLTGPDGRPAGRRFEVYRNNVAVSLTDALRLGFPVVRTLLGDDFFTALAHEFLRAHPPVSPILMLYGAALPDFLAGFGPVAHLGYLPDVARLELALREAYHAADAAAVAPEALQALSPGALMAARLGLAPAVRLLRSRWPVLAIWSANVHGTEAPRSATGEDVLVVRPGYDPEPLLLAPGAAAFIAALQDGLTVGAAIEAAGPFDLTATFGCLLQGGAITTIS
ncbi:MAG: putative DNA-binding domain-containing protein [Defluviimonas sp.]|uniref:HvfC/BufC family peptide modification chaperone n=1 Tax=Albidovulum sp. TaxID=1872424 RepID=UPI001D3FF334|nr:putative DNA-binding domain-containing protein [Paracoccaceae bacterium]MCC0064516.1 putative DNA-binding domain-containing protein [Defluviimonas sp.]